MAQKLPQIRFDKVEELFDWKEAKQLGSGTFGSVYNAVSKIERPPDIKAGCHYAVKVIKKANLTNAKHWTNVIHEIEILKSIRSSYCIQLFDAFQTERDIFLVLELVDGGELFDVIIERGHLTELEAQEITRQLIEALTYLHREKVVHRDLKPENILINKSTMRIKLIDFGFAKFIGTQDELPNYTMNLSGTPPQLTIGALSPGATIPSTPGDLIAITPLGSLKYLAPEILLRLCQHGIQPRVTTRTDIQKIDIFAIGVVVYVMLGGAFPFSSKSKQGLATQIESGIKFPESRFSGVSEAARSFCRWLLDPDRRRRPLAVECFNHEWLRIAVPPTPLEIRKEEIENDMYDRMREIENEYDDQADAATGIQNPEAKPVAQKPNQDIVLSLPKKGGKKQDPSSPKSSTASTSPPPI